jgi:hypothetical protein
MAVAHRTTSTRATALLPRALAVFLVLHGIAHFVGTGGTMEVVREGGAAELLAGAWTPNDATLLTTFAVLWAVSGIAFAVVAVMLWTGRPQARTTLMIVAGASLVLSLVHLPAAIVGVVINVALIAIGALAPRRLHV